MNVRLLVLIPILLSLTPTSGGPNAAPSPAPALATGTTFTVSSSGGIPVAGSPAIPFGIDGASALLLSNESLTPTYGTLWVGSWNLEHGWREPDQRLDQLREGGITPYIHFYYWGDDIHPSCFNQGCSSQSHGVNKNRTEWDRLANELTQHLNTRLQGAPAVIVLETEFNKAAVAGYEPLDEFLAQKATTFRAGYPAATIVLGFGNWGHHSWVGFDRAAAASDAVGLQAMRASTRHTSTQYGDVVQDTVSAVRQLRQQFGKPVHLTDIALSSFPDQEGTQNETLARLLAAVPELQKDGVEAIVYRALFDQPSKDTTNYFGSAEQHWGLRSHDGRDKPAFATWKAFAVGAAPTALPAATAP